MWLKRLLRPIGLAALTGLGSLTGCDRPSSNPTANPSTAAQAEISSPSAAPALRQSDFTRLMMDGRALTQQQATELEAQLETNRDDLQARAKLLGYYFLSGSSKEARAAHQAHVLWVIEHHPESELAGAPLMRLDEASGSKAFDRAMELWDAHCESQPDNPSILGHAAAFVAMHDSDKALRLLDRAQQIEPDNEQWRHQRELIFQIQAMQASRRAGNDPESLKQALATSERALAQTTGTSRFYMLGDVAKLALRAGEKEKAHRYATELLDMSVQIGHDWNFGNAVHHGNLVLGHLALQDGDVDAAERYLLQAGRTTGSPQLNSFGPNMLLAKALVEASRKDAVIQYLDLCAAFWKSDRGRLAQWKKQVADGQTPDFGANLRY